ncbi:hypothetical protein BN1723_011954, partial [Verticillium longisporum]
MSVVSLLGVRVLNNPAKFTDKYEFEITFECLEQLQKDLEWKLTYVGSATSDQYDQELDDLLVGPIPVGVNKFIFEAGAPDTTRIPDADILGVTVILLTCAYDGREFIRVGYYVNNEYDSEELNAEPPSKPITHTLLPPLLPRKHLRTLARFLGDPDYTDDSWKQFVSGVGWRSSVVERVDDGRPNACTKLDDFWAGRHSAVWPHPDPDGPDAIAWRETMAGLRTELERACRDLEHVAQRNTATRKEIENLRDQLFSGSSIKESRRAIEQGDNIKILTLSSMVFLPLTFVT